MSQRTVWCVWENNPTCLALEVFWVCWRCRNEDTPGGEYLHNTLPRGQSLLLPRMSTVCPVTCKVTCYLKASRKVVLWGLRAPSSHQISLADMTASLFSLSFLGLLSDPGAKTPSCQHMGPGFDLWSGNWILCIRAGSSQCHNSWFHMPQLGIKDPECHGTWGSQINKLN